MERTRGRTVIWLERKQFPTPVTFGEEGEQSLLGALALEDAMLAVDPHSRRLISVDALEIGPARKNKRGSRQDALKQQLNEIKDDRARPTRNRVLWVPAPILSRPGTAC